MEVWQRSSASRWSRCIAQDSISRWWIAVEQFLDQPPMFQGFWWSVVSMTTVGYGDKTPRTVVGRFLGIVRIFTGITVCGILTAMLLWWPSVWSAGMILLTRTSIKLKWLYVPLWYSCSWPVVYLLFLFSQMYICNNLIRLTVRYAQKFCFFPCDFRILSFSH